MSTFPQKPEALGLFYTATGEERHVAAWVRADGKWLYHSRGTVGEAASALRHVTPGRIAGIGTFAREDIQICLDQPSWGERDSKDLCWGGARMTAAEFLGWYDGKKRVLNAALRSGRASWRVS